MGLEQLLKNRYSDDLLIDQKAYTLAGANK